MGYKKRETVLSTEFCGKPDMFNPWRKMQVSNFNGFPDAIYLNALIDCDNSNNYSSTYYVEFKMADGTLTASQFNVLRWAAVHGQTAYVIIFDPDDSEACPYYCYLLDHGSVFNLVQSHWKNPKGFRDGYKDKQLRESFSHYPLRKYRTVVQQQ